MIPLLFFVVSVVGAWHTFNALRPVRPRRFGIGPLWAPALVTAELALHHIAWQAVATAVFVWLGALDGVAGRLGLGLTVASWAGLLELKRRALNAGPAIRSALDEALGETAPGDVEPRLRPLLEEPMPLWRLLRPVPRLPEGVRREPEIPYGEHPRQVFDLYVPEQQEQHAPLLVQIHGGSWMRGRHDRQARPLMYHLAERGFVVAAVSYRVSPEATFPEHLIDVKRAIARVRDEGRRRGWDTGYLAVTGGSAGGHLAAMAALTGNDPAYQPGFEEADTSVSACIPMYAVLDLQRSDGRPLWPFLERHVLKRSPSADPAAWRRASPVHLVDGQVPPFFVVHGSHDSVVWAKVSRRFVEALRLVADVPVAYAEIPGATHGLEFFSSLRSKAVVEGVARFLAVTHARAAAEGS